MRPYVDAELRDALRRAIDARRRELAEVPEPCPIRYGTSYGYRLGCRCRECRAASAATRLRYRNANREQENARDRVRRRRRRLELAQQHAGDV